MTIHQHPSPDTHHPSPNTHHLSPITLLVLVFLLLCLTATAQPRVRITNFDRELSGGGKKITGIQQCPLGIICFSTWDGLYRFDGYRFTTAAITPGDGSDLANSRLDDIALDAQGRIIVRSYDKNYVFNPELRQFKLLNQHINWHTFGEDHNHHYPFTRDGYHLMVDNHQLLWTDTPDGQPQVLADSLALAYVDHQGVVWAMTQRTMQLIRIIVDREQTWYIDKGTSVLTVYRDAQNRLWQGNNDGSIALRDENGQLQGYLSPTGDISGAKHTIGRAYCFTQTRDGHIYIGTREDGLYELTPDGQRFHLQHFMPEQGNAYSLSDKSVYALLCDSRGRLWVGTYKGGLSIMTRDANGHARFLHRNNGHPNLLPCDRENSIRSITQMGSVIVLGTTNGIYTVSSNFKDLKQARFYHSTRIPDDATTLSSNEVTNVKYIKGQGLFVCTRLQGVNIVWEKDGTAESLLLKDNIHFHHWSEGSGLLSDDVFEVSPAANGKLWVAYTNALGLIEPKTMQTQNFLVDYTHMVNSSLTPLAFMDNGNLFGATKDGLQMTNVHRLHSNKYCPPLLITSLRSHNQDIHFTFGSDTLRLAKNERDFAIEFTALSTEGTENIEYRYRMKEDKNGWISLGRERTINFHGLKGGTYHLWVSSSNNDGIWTGNDRMITIIIARTFWETGWAWLLYFLLAFFIVTATVTVVLYVYRLHMNVDFEKQMAELKLRFFTDISHDLRTPLTLIEGPVSEMLRDDTQTDKSKGYLTLIHNNTQRMLTLVNQILDFRKVQNGKMRLFVERLNLEEELRKIMNDFSFLASEHHIKLELQNPSGEETTVWGDRDKLQKIFFNLLSNAFKYTPQGKEIWIELQQDADTVTASVCDTGKGMKQSTIEKLFSRFETVLKDNYGLSSTGIGLSLVKELTTLHHGQIQIESEEGKGSRIILTFKKGNSHFLHDENTELMEPRQQADADDTAASDTAASDTATGKKQLLIAEDDAEMLQFVTDILSQDYQVITAADGEEALRKAHETTPDLIISDIQMPRMDGWQLVAAIKADVETSHLPVVLLTAKTSPDDRIRGAELGVDDYITKPFNTDYLRLRIRTILDNLQRRQAKNFSDTLHGGIHLELPEDNSGVQQRMMQEDANMMNKLRDFMEEHLSDNLPIQDMAEHVGMSRTLFYNKIKSLTGLTPLDFYRKYHVERAAQMIRSKGYTASEACYSTGFSDPKYFSRVFKKFMGMTPTEYRNGE